MGFNLTSNTNPQSKPPKVYSSSGANFGLEKSTGFGIRKSTAVIEEPEEQVIEEPDYSLTPWEKYEPYSLTQEKVINDPNLMRVVDNALEARYGDRSQFAGVTTALLGGATASFRGKSKKERFEIYQNWMRSFSGGQTVTTANELGFASRATEEQWQAVSAGYMLMDKGFGNIFTGEGTWGDTFDGVTDYVWAGLVDPATILSLGVGKLFTGVGTKTASFAVKEAGKAAFTKSLKKKGATIASAKLAQKEARKQAIKNLPKYARTIDAAKSVAKYSGVDFAANIGTDIAYQNLMIDANVQEEYSFAQTGFTALGTLVIPELMAVGKGIEFLRDKIKTGSDSVLLKNLENYIPIYDQLKNKSFDEITGEIKKRTNTKNIMSDLKDSFSNFEKNKDKFIPWFKARELAKKDVKDKTLVLDENVLNFWNIFLFGGENKKGFIHSLSDNGFVYINRSGLRKSKSIQKGSKVVASDRGNIGTVVSREGDTATVRFTNKETGATETKVFNLKDLKQTGAKKEDSVNPQQGDNVTNFIGDAMTWVLDEDFVKKFVKNYEDTFGKLGRDKPKSVKEFSDMFKARGSFVGQELSQRSRAEGILNKRKGLYKTGSLQKQFIDEATKEKIPDAQVLRYTQSVWKRLLTAHPSTTGLNLKGFAFYSMMNTTSDLVLGAMKLGEGAFRYAIPKLDFYNPETAYKEAIQSGKGSIIGGLKKGINYLTPHTTLESANQYLDLKPEIREKLFRIIAGDAGDRNAIKTFGMNEESRLLNGVEKTVTGLQQASGVIIQDEVTKLLSFHTALETAILREYGQTFNEFMSRSDAYIEMSTPRFKSNVDAKALHRAQIETASKPWSIKQGKSVTLSVAKFIEKVSTTPGLGFLVPFGQFFNTSLAMLGDYSGVNAAKHLIGRIKGETVNFSEEEGMELLSKAMVGWVAMPAYFIPQAEKKLAMGFKWSQEENADGSVEDSTYSWPESYARIVAQMRAHLIKDGEIPSGLIKEATNVIVGATFRQLDDASKSLLDGIINALGGNLGEAAQNSAEAFILASSRVVSGALRPLDPINEAILATMGDGGTIDRNQGDLGERFIAQSFRYVDSAFSLFGKRGEDKALPTRGSAVDKNYGKTMLGARETSRPNDIEKILNRIGVPDWSSIQWDGDPEVKNVMNSLFGNIFNQEAEYILNKYPNFLDLPLNTQEKEYNKIKKRAKDRAEKEIDVAFGDKYSIIRLKKRLGGILKKDIKRAQRYLGIEEDPYKLVEEEGGVEKLELLIHFAETIDEYILD